MTTSDKRAPKEGVVLARSAETAAWYVKAQFVHGHLIFVLLLTGLTYLVGAMSLLEM
jgi:hypothetical protein